MRLCTTTSKPLVSCNFSELINNISCLSTFSNDEEIVEVNSILNSPNRLLNLPFSVRACVGVILTTLNHTNPQSDDINKTIFTSTNTMMPQNERSSSHTSIISSSSLPATKHRSRGGSSDGCELRLVRVKSILRVDTNEESHRTVNIGQEAIDFTSGSASVLKRVSFRNVNVREYDLTIGDNPSCSAGPPLRYVDQTVQREVF